MEKVSLGFQMARNWTDPTILLIAMVPCVLVLIGITAFFAYAAYLTFPIPFVLPTNIEDPFVFNVGMVFVPYLFSVFFWKVLYHSLFEEPEVDTSQFMVWKTSELETYYRHRRIPMCDLVEYYTSGQFDWNVECEGGDCYMILEKHRHEFVNFKVTFSQIYWLLSQFTSSWMVGRGLGKGSSSGKSIEETTKEIDEHYNKGNDVFSCILGKAMVYTCGVFHQVPEFASSGHDGDYAASAADGTLETAQYNKMKLICDKLMLKENETFLDIGCGWGTLARHAASEVGADAHGVTLSREGKIYCDMASERTGIPTKIYHCDYREIPDAKFDKIASIEMAEHVGIKNFVDPYLKSVKGMLANDDSMFLMQVAGLRQGSNWEDVAWGLFMSKFVFPGADASTPLNWYIRQCEMAGFEIHSVETIGRHYSHTLHKWYDNWMSHKEEILSGEIHAISDHSQGDHLFRLNELTWAWCTIASGQSTATCYQILMHPNTNDFPRDQWVNEANVTGEALVGIGLNQPYTTKSTPKKTAAKKTPAKKSAKKATPKKSAKKATPKASAKKSPAKRVPSTKKMR